MRTTKKLTEVVEEWLDDMDVSYVTRSDYKRKISLWFRYLSLVSVDPRIPMRKDVVEYKRWLEQQHKSLYTVNSYTTVVKLFYKWCASKRYWDDIGQGVKASAVAKYYNKIPLSWDQAQQLMQSVDTSTVIGRRDKLIIMLMILNGLRTCEVQRIDIADFSVIEQQPVLYIQRKGRTDKRESVVLHPDVVELFQEYIADRDFQSSDPLFISHRKIDEFKVIRLTKHSIARMIKKRLKAVGISDRKISAHSLRHTFGSLLVEQGVDIDLIKDMMGHTSTSTTRIYIEMARRRRLLHNSPAVSLADRLLKKDNRHGSLSDS